MAEREGVLSKFRVLELGSTIAGPFCGRLLADFGAEVIKVEQPEGDPVRSIGKTWHGKSLYAASIFRNKSLISVDLRKPEGQAIIRTLVEQCDVVVENFRPGGLEAWNLGYEHLKAVRPDLIMVRISGYGQSGPYSQRPGYGIIGEAVSGLRFINGDPDRPPARMATALTDYITGLYGAFGAVLALLHRQMSGRGQLVDAALYECAFSFMEPFVPAYEKLGVIAQRAGSRMADVAPNNLYVAGDGRYVHIAAFADGVFRRLCEAMGEPQLADDPRFRTANDRNANVDAIDDLVAGWTCRHGLEEIERVLGAAGVPATRIYSIADIFQDPHYRARGALAEVPDGDIGSVTLAAPAPRLSLTPGKIRESGRRIGQDTRAVLGALAGLEPAELDRLEQTGIIHSDRPR